MQIVIDIPEETYKNVQWYGTYLNPRDKHNLEQALKSGTPLPKGHDRLIDAGAYRKDMLDSREFDFFKRLDMQPTIIEADKGE